jgi:hypothetical protein
MPIFILFIYFEKNGHFGAAEVNQINIAGLETKSYLKIYRKKVQCLKPYDTTGSGIVLF